MPNQPSGRIFREKLGLTRSFPAVRISLLKSKVHRAVVTGADLNYEGSLTISADLAEVAGLEEYERILVGFAAAISILILAYWLRRTWRIVA